MSTIHEPVMVNEMLEHLGSTPSGLIVDGTLGMGGHTAALLEVLPPSVNILGIDWDQEALSIAKERLAQAGERVLFKHGSYTQAHLFVEDLDMPNCQGIMLDLGLSSYTLEGSGRGFSFQVDEPHDMRYDSTRGRPLSKIMPGLDAITMAGIFRQYSDEKRAMPIARAIADASSAGRLQTTGQLVVCVKEIVKGQYALKSVARIFQAFRIYMNGELDNLQTFLKNLADLLDVGGKAVFISFHSIEDRIVKHFFNHESRDCICPPELPECRCDHKALYRIITKRPLIPTDAEIAGNSRARSAKMRVMERI